jgi:hypothetical protein
VFIMSDDERPDALSEREVAALRVLRPFALEALNRASGELVMLGKQHELAQSLDAIAVIDRLTGDGGDEPASREELQLEGIRFGSAIGYSVTFEPDGSVSFTRGAVTITAGDLLKLEEPLEEWLRREEGRAVRRADDMINSMRLLIERIQELQDNLRERERAIARRDELILKLLETVIRAAR